MYYCALILLETSALYKLFIYLLTYLLTSCDSNWLTAQPFAAVYFTVTYDTNICNITISLMSKGETKRLPWTGSSSKWCWTGIDGARSDNELVLLPRVHDILSCHDMHMRLFVFFDLTLVFLVQRCLLLYRDPLPPAAAQSRLQSCSGRHVRWCKPALPALVALWSNTPTNARGAYSQLRRKKMSCCLACMLWD